MYLVDTSIWIHGLRPTGNAEIQARLKPLILDGQTTVTEWILLELMTGLVKSEQPSSLLQWFTPVPRLPFNPEWWAAAWDLAGRLRSHGVSPSATD
jgi:predicted nucleic acid-binding protein